MQLLLKYEIAGQSSMVLKWIAISESEHVFASWWTVSKDCTVSVMENSVWEKYYNSK